MLITDLTQHLHIIEIVLIEYIHRIEALKLNNMCVCMLGTFTSLPLQKPNHLPESRYSKALHYVSCTICILPNLQIDIRT